MSPIQTPSLLERIMAFPVQAEAFAVNELAPPGMRDPSMLGVPRHARRHADFYATPEWITEVLCRHVPFRRVWEPACGEGHMSKILDANADCVRSTDLYDRGYGSVHGVSFLDMNSPYSHDSTPYDIVTNPPFSLADEFVEHARELAKYNGTKVAMLMRNEWDCAFTRSHLFAPGSHFRLKLVLTKRPRWIEGSTGSPRHNYAWYVWDFGMSPGAPTIIYDQ